VIARGALGLAVLALLGLPGCLDPIVGANCKAGYSPCHGTCVRSGTCRAIDASMGSGIDGEVAEAGTGALDLGEESEAGTTTVDGGQSDVFAVDGGEDGVGTVDGATDEDAVAAGGGDAANPEVAVDDVALRADAPVGDAAAQVPDLPLADAPAATGPAIPLDADEGPVDVDDGLDLGGGCGACLDSDTDDAGPSSFDGASGDGGPGDDAGSPDDTDASDDGSPGEPEPLVCAGGQVICNDQCVDPSLDYENCGHCNNICESGVCNGSKCLVCEATQVVCGRQCVNINTDPDNCGTCGHPCTSGLCSNGVCEAAGTGHAIVIGHDYLRNRPVMNRILGNAVFLWPVNPVELLVYEGDADPTAIAGADGAIQQVAAATGRLFHRRAALEDEVSAQLASADVFLIYGQAGASDDTLARLGQKWKAALNFFLQTGGTMILLDGLYGANLGTVQILSQSTTDDPLKLFNLTRNVSTTDDVCTVIAGGDALAAGLPKTYRCEQNSTSFLVSGASTNITAVVAVVADDTQTVVLHKLF